jgi:hypothetical protein
MPNFELTILPNRYSVCQLPAGAPIPDWAQGDDLLAIIRTADELTIVCEAAKPPADVRIEKGWRVFKVAGPLDFSMVGVLSSLTGTLAEIGVAIFALSTFDTDYILVKGTQLEEAEQALLNAGHSIKHL